MPRFTRIYHHSYLFKALWQGTALRFIVDADNFEKAEKKAAVTIWKLMGRETCQEIVLLRQLS